MNSMNDVCHMKCNYSHGHTAVFPPFVTRISGTVCTMYMFHNKHSDIFAFNFRLYPLLCYN